MIDCIMVCALLAVFGLVWLLIRWCQRQTESEE